MARPNLNDRHRRILKFVVESHVARAEPVGSQYVRMAYHLSISPATIRGAMKRLEEEGLLGHPHTSAGRIPTEAGYRYYVDALMVPEPLPASTRRAVDTAFAQSGSAGRDDPHAVATRVLAKCSGQLAVLAVRPWAGLSAEHLELFALEEGVVLLALGEGGARVTTTTWRPTVTYPEPTIRLAERWIAARLPLRDAAACESLAGTAARSAPAASVRLIVDALERAGKLLDSERRPEVRIGGAENIAAQPEFQTADRLRGLVSLLAEPEPLARALSAFMDQSGARITIGRENGEGTMRACSIVGTGIVSRRLRGSVGVLGPVRMRYPRLLSLVSYVGERLPELT
jgi:heat-inducible transcriptional repressor